MKLLYLSFFAASIFAKRTSIFEQANEANSVLRAKRASRGFLDIFGTTDANQVVTTQSYEEIQRQKVGAFIDEYHLTSVEAWHELKETMEKKGRSNVPEEKLDELENCITACKMDDGLGQLGAGDKSIEEQKENQEEAYEKSCKKGRCDETVFTKLIPCPKCFRYIPAVGGDLIGDVTSKILGQVDPVELFKNVVG